MPEGGELLEALAALEHEQWVIWSRGLAQTENLSKARLDRWQKFWVPYSELSEAAKEPDRMWARKVLDKIGPVVGPRGINGK